MSSLSKFMRRITELCIMALGFSPLFISLSTGNSQFMLWLLITLPLTFVMGLPWPGLNVKKPN